MEISYSFHLSAKKLAIEKTYLLRLSCVFSATFCLYWLLRAFWLINESYNLFPFSSSSFLLRFHLSNTLCRLTFHQSTGALRGFLWEQDRSPYPSVILILEQVELDPKLVLSCPIIQFIQF
jgi:hypothetical protein